MPHCRFLRPSTICRCCMSWGLATGAIACNSPLKVQTAVPCRCSRFGSHHSTADCRLESCPRVEGAESSSHAHRRYHSALHRRIPAPMDAVLLSRLQFAWVVALHILLPAFTVGLAAYIAALEGAHFFTRKPMFLRLSQSGCACSPCRSEWKSSRES